MRFISVKKILIICLSLLLVLCMTACGSEVKPAEKSNTAASATSEPVSFNLSKKEDNIDGKTFDGDVIITGDDGKLIFTSCTFNGNIISNGGEGAVVFVGDNCKFAKESKCIIDSTIKEATQDTNLPKFIILCEMPEVSCKNIGAVVAPANMAIRLNGSKYPIEAAEYYLNESTGDFAPYSGQESTMHNFAMWTENGKAVQMHIAVYTTE